jgi:hypothetical protein
MSDNIDWQRLRSSFEDHIREHNSRVASTRRCLLCNEPLQAYSFTCFRDEGRIEWENRETLQSMLDI